jgi:hypothetical protein
MGSILPADIQVRTALASKALSRQELDAAEAHAEIVVLLDPDHGNPHLVLAQVSMAKIMNRVHV